MQCRTNIVFLWLAAVTWCTITIAAPVAQEEELYAAETRRAQGWFKGIGYGSFGFSEEDSAEDDKVEGKGQSESVSQQQSGLVTGKKKEEAKQQETSGKKQQQEVLLFKDYYHGFRGQYEESRKQYEESRKQDDESRKQDEESRKQDEKKSKDEDKNRGYAIMEQHEEDIHTEDQERKELEQKLKEYFAHLEADEKKNDKSNEGGYSELGELTGHGKLAFSAVHQTSYFPTFNYQDYQQQSKSKDSKENSRFNYQYFFPTQH